MNPMLHGLWPIAAAVLGAVAFYFARTRSRASATARVEQLDAAAELLNRHAAALKLVLGDADTPADLKHLLLSLSDAMADPEVMARLSAWAASRESELAVTTPETEALAASLVQLQARRPDLCDGFITGVWTAIFAASLRWPASIAGQSALARLVSTPKRDVVVAVTASNLRTGGPFSFRPAAEAVA